MFKIYIVLISIIILCSCSKNSDVSQLPTEPDSSDSSKINDVLFIVSDIGKLEAIDANTGATRWTFVLDNNANINTTTICSSPTYKDGVVYIGSSDYNVYAIDARTGIKKWSYLTDPIAIAGYGFYYSSPIVVDGVLYIGGAKMYAINIIDGSLKWAANLGGAVNSSPTVANGVVYVVGNSQLYLIDVSTGLIMHDTRTLQWGFLTYKFSTNSPCYYNGQLYIAAEYYHNPTYKGTCIFNIVNSQAWQYMSFPLSSENTYVYYSSPTVKNQTLYVCSDSTLFAYDLQRTSNNLKWKFSATGNFPISSPVADSFRVYVGDNEGKFYAVNALNGQLEWSINTALTNGSSRGINNSPTVANGVVFFSNDKGIYSVNASNGNLYWFRPTFGIYGMGSSGCVVSKSGQIFHSSISGVEN